MSSTYSIRKLGIAILGLVAFFGVAIASSATAQAQYRYPDRYPDQYPRRDDRRDDRYGNRRDDRYGRGGNGGEYRYAADQGYRDGLSTGEDDARRGESNNPYRSHYYRNATDGYNGSYGNRDAYRQAFRDGFLRGYQEGFQRYRGGGRRGGYYPRRYPF